MTNLFKNAYLGKTYKTRDGQKAIYQTILNGVHILFTETLKTGCTDDGRNTTHGHQFDIVSEWKEEIDEEELEKLAEQSNPYPAYDKSDTCVAHSHDGFNEGFQAGYRAALKKIKL